MSDDREENQSLSEMCATVLEEVERLQTLALALEGALPPVEEPDESFIRAMPAFSPEALVSTMGELTDEGIDADTLDQLVEQARLVGFQAFTHKHTIHYWVTPELVGTPTLASYFGTYVAIHASMDPDIELTPGIIGGICEIAMEMSIVDPTEEFAKLEEAGFAL